jgi:prepilin-type processing-associated H-X9-DG protein
VAILVYSGDYENHTPPAYQIQISNGQTLTWYTLLTNGNYATPKVFQCPDDRRIATVGNTPRSYAMVIGYGNTASSYGGNKGNFWIAGSRLTCPYLTNSSVAIVAEYYTYYSDNPAILPTVEDNGTISPFVTSSYDYNPNSQQQSGYPPRSKHLAKAPLTGNYLFLDGHVEYVNSLLGSGSYPTSDPRAAQMFPQPPTREGATGAICP